MVETPKETTKTDHFEWYLNAENARKIDEDLMGDECRYTLAQLMELAGLAVAQATHDFLERDLQLDRAARILTVCGPGNNGGDGVVAARHLKFWGYKSHLYYPKATTNQYYLDILHQADKVGVTSITELGEPEQLKENYDVVIDAVFGFSFQAAGEIREPFGSLLDKINAS